LNARKKSNIPPNKTPRHLKTKHTKAHKDQHLYIKV